jgi:excisionase family DNA binding protein
MSTHAIDSGKPATLADVRHLGAVHVWHPTKPDAADVLGVSRDLAYAMARSGELPTIRLGRRVMVPVPELRRMLGDLPPAEPESLTASGH